MAVIRDAGPSANQSFTFDAWGNAEDISPIITSITPDKTPFLSSIPDGPNAVEPAFSWPTEELHPPMVNKHLEKEDYQSHEVGSMEALDNVVQIFMTTGFVTDMQRKARKVYRGGDEFNRQLTKAFTEHARDIEYAFVNNDTKTAGTAAVQAMTGGLPYFMKKKTLSATVDTSTGKITTSAAHNLKTGDFVYFDAATMPTGLKKNTLYYVRLDATTPATIFTIFPSMKSAVENITAKQVIPTTAGTTVVCVLNNVVDLNNGADYTVADINSAMEMAYRRGGQPDTLWASPHNKARFSEIVNAMSYTTRKSGDKKTNMVATTLETDFGVVDCKPHLWFPNDFILALDSQYLEKKWFEKTHKVSGLAKKGNYSEFVIESSIGLKFDQPLSSAAIINIKE
jgi:hypothetical protein